MSERRPNYWPYVLALMGPPGWLILLGWALKELVLFPFYVLRGYLDDDDDDDDDGPPRRRYRRVEG